ncbi:pseudouridine synthase, partial [Candidatus Woesearchaeota archaeon]|nr:pseudouridine synthase [Candidatus Woesearchaeota archaeon]
MRLIKDGKVKVDDRVITNPIFEFRPNTKPVYINGEKIEGQKEELYFIFNKPQGVICQKNDPEGRPS